MNKQWLTHLHIFLILVKALIDSDDDDDDYDDSKWDFAVLGVWEELTGAWFVTILICIVLHLYCNVFLLYWFVTILRSNWTNIACAMSFAIIVVIIVFLISIIDIKCWFDYDDNSNTLMSSWPASSCSAWFCHQNQCQHLSSRWELVGCL